MKKYLFQANGFTLIELLVTLGLLGLVIASGFSLYFFADRSFVSGTLTADIQADMDYTMRRISNELRLAHKIEFKNSVPAANTLTEDEHYLFVENDLVKLRTQNNTQILTNSRVDMSKFKLTLAYDNTVPNLLGVKLQSLTPGVPYALESSIEFLNLRSATVTGDTSKGIVYFTKTLSVEERADAEVVRDRCFLLSTVFDDQDPDLNVFRRFRDEKLSSSKLGRSIIRWYYTNSPQIGEYLEKTPALLAASRIFFHTLAFWLQRDGIIFSLGLTFVLASCSMVSLRRKQSFGEI